jgi:hypothetical protein
MFGKDKHASLLCHGVDDEARKVMLHLHLRFGWTQIGILYKVLRFFRRLLNPAVAVAVAVAVVDLQTQALTLW